MEWNLFKVRNKNFGTAALLQVLVDIIVNFERISLHVIALLLLSLSMYLLSGLFLSLLNFKTQVGKWPKRFKHNLTAICKVLITLKIYNKLLRNVLDNRFKIFFFFRIAQCMLSYLFEKQNCFNHQIKRNYKCFIVGNL